LALRARLDNLWRNDHFLLDHKETSIVVVRIVVVRTTCDRKNLVVSISVHAVHTDLVASDHHADLIVLKEFLYNVCTV